MAIAEQLLADVSGPPRKTLASIYHYLARAVKENSQAQAVVDCSSPPNAFKFLLSESHQIIERSGPCLIWTFEELHHAAIELAAKLQDHGISTNSVVTIFVPNGIEFVLFLWASVILKTTFVSLDSGMTTAPRAAELRSILDQVKPDLVIAKLDSARMQAIENTLVETKGKTPMLKLDLHSSKEKMNESWVNLDNIFGKPASKSQMDSIIEQAYQDDLNRISNILFTSGTSSGKPKGAPRQVRAVIHVLENQPEVTKPFVTPPQGWRFPLATANFRAIATALSLALWTDGFAIIIPEILEPMKILDAIETHHVTFVPFIPGVAQRLRSTPGFSSRDLTAVQVGILSGDIAGRSQAQAVKDAFPGIHLINGHGMTECAHVICWRSLDDAELINDIYPCGKASPNSRVTVRDVDSTRILCRNEPGELCYPASLAIPHYLNSVQPETFFKDELEQLWFRSGDAGFIDDEGLIYITSRSKDIIKRAGIPINPLALATNVSEFVGSQAVVIGIPHPDIGAEPFAVVTQYNGRSKEAISNQILAVFGKDYALGGVLSLSDLGLTGFPVNATNKVLKFELQELVIAKLNTATAHS